MSAPPEGLVQSLSLREFCRKAKHISDQGNEDTATFIKFALTGEHSGQQYSIDPILNVLTDQHATRGMRDYDSLLGIEPQISIEDSLTVYPVSRFEDTLLKSVHLDYDVVRGEVTHRVPLHRIPNIGLGKWGTHNLVRVLFPALWNDQRRGPIMTQDEQKIFYEKGLRPAVVELMEQWAGDWPPTYQSEMIRARGPNGRLAFQSKILPSWHVGALGDTIRHHLELHDIPWADGLVFLHQIKGVKGSSRHQDTQAHVDQALDEFFADNRINRQGLNPDLWWIDVGFEFTSSRGDCLQWRTDHHRHVISSIFDITEERAESITRQGSSKYTRDVVAHLPSVSGCRIVPGVQSRGPYAVRYAQLYTTDKSLTYKSGGAVSSLSMGCKDVFKEGAGSKFTDGLHQIYVDASATSPSHARMEVRVPIAHAATVLVNVDVAVMRDSLLAFGKTAWWSFRLYRLMACQYVFDWYSEGTPRNCSQDDALLLICALVWLVNGLNSTPDLRSASRSLLTAVLPHVHRDGADPNILAFPSRTTGPASDAEESDDPEDMSLVRPTIPYVPHGVVFLRPILLGNPHPVPRLEESAYHLSPKAFEFFFKVPKQHIRDKYLQPGITTLSTRISNKTRKTMHWINLGDTHPETLFDLNHMGFAIDPPEFDPEDQAGLADPMRVDEVDNIDEALSLLWRNFVVDLLRKSPNPKSASKPSYLTLTAAQRELGTEAIFKDRRLSAYWTDCQWKVGTHASWSSTFEHLWPAKGHILQAKAQHYPQCCYYSDWCALTARTDAMTVTAMRQSLRLRFDKLYWVPAALSDRIWLTKWDKNSQKSSGIDATSPAPRILINPTFGMQRPTW